MGSATPLVTLKKVEITWSRLWRNWLYLSPLVSKCWSRGMSKESKYSWRYFYCFMEKKKDKQWAPNSELRLNVLTSSFIGLFLILTLCLVCMLEFSFFPEWMVIKKISLYQNKKLVNIKSSKHWLRKQAGDGRCYLDWQGKNNWR